MELSGRTVHNIQYNRNPFIDDPSWVFDIWGPTTSINNEISSESFQLYPNPVNDKCLISFPDELETHSWDIKVHNITGKEITVDRFDNIQSVELSTSDLLPGMYFIILTDQESTRKSKFILRFIK